MNFDTSSAWLKKFELISFPSADELASRVAGDWLDEIESANRTARRHCVALSGGRIAPKLFAAAIEQSRARSVSFSHAHFFWADERCVPPDDPESNFAVARQSLLSPLKIPDGQVHRIRGEAPPQVAADEAGAEICRIAPLNENGRPVLDLVLLGMGEDGHIASLFPNAPPSVLTDNVPFLVVENSPKPPPRRVSLSYAALAAASQVCVLVTGAGKERALRESLAHSGSTPLARVIQSRPRTKIFYFFS